MKTEFHQDRFDKWGTRRGLPVDRYSTRIQKDLNTIPFPDIRKIESTYFWGKAGTGKTINAIHLMLSHMRMCYSTLLVEENCYMDIGECLFITVPEFLNELKKTFQDTYVSTEFEILDKYSNADFLVLDDFGVEKTSDWSYSVLYLLLNRRYENMKPTVITSNLSLSQIATKLEDERITSRINSMCKVLECTKIYRK